MMAFKTAKSKRSLTYSAVILLVISIFLFIYWYYFIPNNRKTIHRNGFLILQTIAGNIEDLTDSRILRYKSYYKNTLSKEKSRNLSAQKTRKTNIDSLLKTNKIDATVHISADPSIARDATEIRIENGMLVVSFSNDSLKEKVEFSENINPLVESILSTQRTELFQSYLLAKLKGTTSELLYYDKELAVRSDQGIDSLLPRGAEAYLTGIRELNLYEVSQKVFYYPFRLQQTQLMIGGFVNSKEYNASLRQAPFYFLYLLTIIFLILIVLLPIIKFYVMDPNEQVRIKDIILFGFSVFTGASFITLMIIHFLLWKGEEYRVRKRLELLSGQIKNNFIADIRKSYEQLTLLDKYKNDHRPAPAVRIDYSDTIRKFVHDSTQSPSRYLYFDRIIWVDSSGEQKIRADLYSNPVFANISDRNYFGVFKKGAPFSLPGDRDKRIGLEPVYSRTNADFNITLSRKDTARGGFIVAMAIQPGSVLNTILPTGYGFCIIDEQGNVQVHSDKNRSLNENFFQKIEPGGDVRSAVTTRQIKSVNDVVAYGKAHQMLVMPLDDLPFHLVTFYDKRFMVPVNLRILVFALAFCFISFLTCLVIWYTILFKFNLENKLVYCRLDAISWLIPRKGEAPYYFHAFRFVIAYVATLLGYIFYNKHYEISNFNIFTLLYVTPINIALLLNTMRASFIRPLYYSRWIDRAKARKRVLLNIGVHLAFSLIIYFSTLHNYHLTIGFLLYQIVINLFLWVYALSKSSSPIFSIGSESNYLKGYYRLATSLVLVLAVLPSAMYTWYAHNQEIIQSIKRQQLHLAHAIRDRSFVIREMKGVNDDSLPVPDFYLDALQFSNGIYTIYQDKVSYQPVTDTTKKAAVPFEDFYFVTVERVSNAYYKQQPYSALTYTAYDGSFYWKREDSFIHFNYYPSLPVLKKQEDANGQKMLTITSKLPPRFIFLNSFKNIFPLLMVISLLVFFLHVWLERNLNRIFLIRHLNGKTKPDMKSELITAYYNYKIGYCPSPYYPFTHNPGYLYTYEEDVVSDIHNRKWLYNEIWARCTEKEKFLLFNMARDGLINYKNTLEIITLLKKGLLIQDNDRITPFSPGFRAYILSICTDDNEDMVRLQKKYLANSTWQLFRMPLVILLIGIAVLIFFTQQNVFDKLLLLAGGISTLTTLVMSVLGAGGKQQAKQEG